MLTSHPFFDFIDRSGCIRDSEALRVPRSDRVQWSKWKGRLARSPHPKGRKGLLGCPRWDSLKSRIQAKQTETQDNSLGNHGPTRLVSLQHAEEIGSVAEKRSCTRRGHLAKALRRQPQGAAPKQHAQCQEAPSSRHAEVHKCLDGPLQAFKEDAEVLGDMAFGDLVELESCGMQVKWSKAELLHAKTCKVRSHGVHSDVGQHGHGQLGNRGPEVQPGPEEEPAELTAALRDLHELYDCGLAVRWPGWCSGAGVLGS